MATSCLFCQIVEKTLPADIVYEDDKVIAFHDISPVAPVHILIIPKQHLATLNEILPEHELLAGRMLRVANILAAQFDVDQSGYRVVMNCNRDGCQEIFHIHLHVIGGKALSWPPGCS